MTKSRISNKNAEDIAYDKEILAHLRLIVVLVAGVILAETLIKYSDIWTKYLIY
jgi:hypothetical protein